MPQTEAEQLAVSCVTDIALRVSKFRYQGTGSFERWVFKLAYNCFIDWLRERSGREIQVDDAQLRSMVTSDTEPNRAVCAAVDQAMARLSAMDRKIVELRNFEVQLTYEEIGEQLAIESGTARVRHHRALKQLEKFLAEQPAIQTLLSRSSSRHRDEGKK